MSSSLSHQDSFSIERRKERAHMRLCYNIQRKIFRLRDKSRHWHAQASFYRGWRGREGNRRRIYIAVQRHVYWSDKLHKHWSKLTIEVNKLKSLTARRKQLQDQLGMAPTAEEYVDYGRQAEDGVRFLLLDHELNSAINVQHFMEENLSGSSLFIRDR